MYSTTRPSGQQTSSQSSESGSGSEKEEKPEDEEKPKDEEKPEDAEKPEDEEKPVDEFCVEDDSKLDAKDSKRYASTAGNDSKKEDSFVPLYAKSDTMF
jgi:hypothetical protein